MSGTETDLMASLVTSLSRSFREVPPAAIPPMLDCLLASTAQSPSSLFSALLEDFPNLIEAAKKVGKSNSKNYMEIASVIGALCHLLKKVDGNKEAIQLFIWKGFIPVLTMEHDFERELLNQIAESFFDVIAKTNSWEALEASFVPFFLASLRFSAGLINKEELDALEWGKKADSKNMDKDSVLSLFGAFPLALSCHVLSLTLNAALQGLQTAPVAGLVNGCLHAGKYAANLLCNLCNVTKHLLLQNLETRSCATGFLLPVIFKAFITNCYFEISTHGNAQLFSRNSFFKELWTCCKVLFSLGSLERRDAYNVLSLLISFLSCTEVSEKDDRSDRDEFDIRTDKEFWNEIKRGLVNEEGLVRKQSIHILKRVLCISDGSQSTSSITENKLQKKHSDPNGMTRREIWADKEAKSLGVGKLYSIADSGFNSQQQWEAFVLLYEMLDEYGTHLVEAAWNHQITVLLQFSLSRDNFISSISKASEETQLGTSDEVFSWLPILWERGFCHDNPQVRCMIMQSFLGIEWKNCGAWSTSIPESFVLGPFLKALDDPVHHTEFGIKGVYSSKAIESAGQFLHYYASYLDARRWMSFLINLASLAKKQSFGRVGLMSLAECIASASCSRKDNDHAAEQLDNASPDKVSHKSPDDDKIELLNLLRFVIQNSKQHFNPNYRVRVCRKVLETAASLIYAARVPLQILLHFISELPREFTDYGGPLQVMVQDWLLGNKMQHAADCYVLDTQLLKDLHDFPAKFVRFQNMTNSFDDEDLEAWELQAKRWARVLFLAIKRKDDLMPTLTFILQNGGNISKQNSHLEWLPLKFNILASCLVQEILVIQDCSAKCSFKRKSDAGLLEAVGQSSVVEASAIYEIFANSFLFILNDMVSFTKLSCSVFWSNSAMENTVLPGSVRGRLGGPSQRRLSQNLTTVVLQAVTSIKAVASIWSFCVQCRSDHFLDSSSNFLWEFFWKAIASPTCESETEAEFRIAAYEALVHVLKAMVPAFSAQDLVLIKEKYASRQPPIKDSALLDTLIISFLQNVNNLLAVGVMARSRRAVLLKWKWLCIESLLSIPLHAFENGVYLEDGSCFFSDVSVRSILVDIVESLENAGEDSALSMLRSVRLALELLFPGRHSSAVSSCSGVGKLDLQIIWKLVRYSWILHVSCNKRRVAPIAALLSAVLHSSLFSDESMHMLNGEPGPLKWFVEKIIQEGTKSPRTIRLAALHLTGLWFSNPTTIKYYVEELKQLTLYGSVAFDEDFEGELAENHDVRTELSLLAKSPDPELTEAYINTELYARVSVAALFYKLARLVDEKESSEGNTESQAALESGKSFLRELLNSAVDDKDLSKDLYKKYSAIHRRKVRAWQMICVLSRFIRDDVVAEFTQSLHIALSKSNLPSVRQYIETFAINIYLKFPALVVEQLVPMLRDYDMRAQALSSYVFIAASVILHASKVHQFNHLDDLLPPIIPLLTSHHHSLRGFTQVLVHQVLHKLFPPWDSTSSETMPLEKRCFEDLKSYLAKNSDCARLRASMEGYLDAFDPNTSSTPAGIFVSRVEEEIGFECVPTSLMEQILNFLNDVREDLRSSMAKDLVTIKNESLNVGDPSSTGLLSNGDKGKDAHLDFQKKIIVSKHEDQDTSAHSVVGNKETYKQLLEMEKEDDLLNQLLKTRSSTMETITGNRQDFILVASFIDRIPNLAGLARTCEVFKASGLAIADTKVIKDKQFQLISVTAEKWVPIIEVPVNSVKQFLEKKKREGYSILGLEQTANSISLDKYIYPKKTVLVLGREKEGIPVDIIHMLDACIEIPQLGIVRSLNVHVSGAIALWEYTRQQRSPSLLPDSQQKSS